MSELLAETGAREKSNKEEASPNQLIIRSDVPPGLTFRDYKQYLRHDFYYSCAYCTMTECEGGTIRFTIDHYVPQSASAELINEYSNLIYACDNCNIFKGDRYPPQSARAEGFRFFRPDHDIRDEHFSLNGLLVDHKTNTGYYTKEFLELNRQSLRRIRDLRNRLVQCDRYVSEGIRGLKSFPIDLLPTELRVKTIKTGNWASTVAEKTQEKIDELLRDYARSPNADPDPDAEERAAARASIAKQLQGIYVGNWRAPRGEANNSFRKTIRKPQKRKARGRQR